MSEWCASVLNEYPNFNIVGECWTSSIPQLAYWQGGNANKDGFDCQILASTYLSLEIQNPQFPDFRPVLLLTERTHRTTLKCLCHIEQAISTVKEAGIGKMSGSIVYILHQLLHGPFPLEPTIDHVGPIERTFPMLLISDFAHFSFSFLITALVMNSFLRDVFQILSYWVSRNICT